jgi:hypothetical protein
MGGEVIEPRPCPFCWALGKDLELSEISPGTWAVACTECGAQGPSNHLAEDESVAWPNATMNQAVAEWNRRA